MSNPATSPWPEVGDRIPQSMRMVVAAALQLLAIVGRGQRPTTVHVHVATPITRQGAGSTDPACIHKILMERMRCLLGNREMDEGVSVL